MRLTTAAPSFTQTKAKGLDSMKVLVACEESQAVTKELRRLGHEAYSCDIQPCSGGHPEWHIRGDALAIINGSGETTGDFLSLFETEDGQIHETPRRWDMILAFPPCTHLAVSGASWFEAKRKDGRQREAIEFFCAMLNADCEKIAVENPVNIISGDYVKKHFPDLAERYGLPLKPTQKIQPYQFGDHAKKTTCLWLKGLPKLTPANIVDPGEIYTTGNERYSVGASANWATDENGKTLRWNDPRTAKIRSKTFPGIARAMAEQWTCYAENGELSNENQTNRRKRLA